MISAEWSKVERRYLRLIGARKTLAMEKVPAEVVSRLLAFDVVRIGVDGRVALSEPGKSLLARLISLDEGAVAGGARAGFDPYRAQHGASTAEVRDIEGCRQRVTVNATESPLGWLLTRQGKDGRSLISRGQFDAGERFRNDFELAGMSPKVTQGWGGVSMGGGRGAAYRDMDYSAMQLSARDRFNSAVDMMGPGLSDIAIWVCCFMEGLEAAERRLGWPVRSGKLVLGLALGRLQKHYGI